MIMVTTYNFGETTAYIGASFKGRNLVVSARSLAPVHLHLRVYEFSDGGLTLAGLPEYYYFSMNLGQLVDPHDRNYRILEILSHTGYNDLDTRRFWKEKLTDYAINAGLIAFNVGVEEVKLNIEIHIRNMARLTLEMEREMVEQERNIFDQGIGARDFGGVPASEDSIKELEVVKYNGVGGEFEASGCSICLKEFEFEMKVTRMPCKHVFHGGCLARWLKKSHLCPLCRYEIPM